MEISETWVALIAVIAALGTAVAALIGMGLSRREFRMRSRPWLGVAEWTSSEIRVISPDGAIYQAGVVIRNFGSLPACDAAITCSVSGESEKREVVKRSGLLLWPGQSESLGWNILPPLSNDVMLLTEIMITYKLTPASNGRVHTRQIRQYYTGSMKFVDAEEGQSYID